MKSFIQSASKCILALLLAGNLSAQPPIKASGPAKVTLAKTDGAWKLFVNGQPFFIKGAGLEFGSQEQLAAAGGNSFRTWRTDNGRETAKQVLDRAAKNGLYVTMGLDLGRERLGFNYSDPTAVQKQFGEIKSQVIALKDHPALLMWDIGNELNLNSHNPEVWTAVNQISKMIHEIDPNHPTTTSLSGISKRVLDDIKARAPDLDLLCFQSYADIVNLPRELARSGWNGPYVVTEWGATGHWECPLTAWGAPVEDSSSVKASLYKRRYAAAITSDPMHCLGSYVFLWGQKQERTPTWYGLFLPGGEATETVDVMQYLWTGQWPEHRSPELKGFWLDGKTARESVHLSSGHVYPARVAAISPEKLKYSWEVMEESAAQSTGGDFEKTPQPLADLIVTAADNQAQVAAPSKPGAYRLFVYAFDSSGRAGYANIPFYVDEKVASVGSQSGP